MNLPLFDPTYSVSELCEEIRTFLAEAFPAVWVSGEVERVRQSRNGHLYFELVEKGEGDEIRGKLDAVLWRTDHQRVRRALAATGQELAEGVAVRCRGRVDFYGPGGRLQFVVREVDPVFTLGLLAQRRRETLAALAAAGLLDRNRALELPPVPLKVALITSEGSAAYHDFLSTLRESGYGFQVLLLHAAMQGRNAEREVASALASLGALAAAGRVECAALIRGGGSKTDLAVFDSRAIAEAIARTPVPVLTGLGHEIDESIADRVAHTALKTPTKVAELLIERVTRAELALEELTADLGRAARERLRQGREALGRAERGVVLARLRLAQVSSRLGEVARSLARIGRRSVVEEGRRLTDLELRLRRAAPRSLRRVGGEPGRCAVRIVAAARGHLRQMEVTLSGLGRLASGLAPERVLLRGYSITRDASGAPLRDAEEVGVGELLMTRLAAGSVVSRVEETRRAEEV